MPIFENVTTKSSREIWRSPDGQRVIYEVTLEMNGKEMKAKTYSEAMTKQGRVGSIETYEKPGRNGNETFVKQPPKENGGAWSAGGGQQQAPAAGSISPAPARNDSHIRAQFAIKGAITYVVASENATFDDIETIATELFHMVDRVKDSEPPHADADAPGDSEQMQQELDDFMNDSTPINLGTDPWKSS